MNSIVALSMTLPAEAFLCAGVVAPLEGD